MAKKFEQIVKSDTRFEILGKVVLGLVCFRLKVNLIFIPKLYIKN